MSENIRQLMAQVASGQLTIEQAKEVASKFVYDIRYVTGEVEHFRATIRHKIGRCMLTRYVSRKRQVWEVYWEGKLVGADYTWEGAFYTAKSRRPPKTVKIQGEIVAYRGWGLLGDILTPVNMAGSDLVTWSGPVAVTDRAPEPHNQHGLYAAKLEHAQSLIDSYRTVIHGLVGLYGKIIEHQRGYRAEKAVVRVLRVVPPLGDALLRALEERYQCQVFRFSGQTKWEDGRW
jgi:hypothetical protein